MGVAALAALPDGLGLTSVASATEPSATEPEKTQDVIVFRSGKQAEGKIISETDTTVVFEGKISGIMIRTEFDKSDILAIRRGELIETEPMFAEAPADAGRSLDPIDNADAAARVYVIEFDGVFGRDISSTPVKNAMRDAKKLGPDVIVVVVSNDWSKALQGGLKEDDLPDDWGMFDEFNIADEIEPYLTENVEREWEKQPRVVYWVKQAMGGAAFVPFWSSEMYFAPDARLGGIGYLERIFGSTGDEVVREKQFSLRLGRARGMAIQSGYEPKLIEALARSDYVLSYKLVGGEPVYFERFPENDGEILLTDDGKDDNEDTIELLARGQGNDVLTLDAELAKTLGVSQGTVASLDDLMFKLGIHRNYEILDGRSDRIMSQWRTGVRGALRQIPRMLKDYEAIEIGGADARERNQARSRQISKLKGIRKILVKYEGAINPRRYGFPSITDIDAMIAGIKLQIAADRD